MVGELNIAIAGRHATIDFLGDQVLVRFTDYRTAIAFARQQIPKTKLFGRLLAWGEFRVKAQVGDGSPVEILPNPNLILQWLSPTLRNLLA